MQDGATVEECAICNVMLNALDTDGTCYLRHGEAIAHKMARAMTKSSRPPPDSTVGGHHVPYSRVSMLSMP